MLGVSCVGVERYGLLASLGYDVYHSARGVAAVEGRGGSLHYLYPLDVVHAEACEVDIVHGLACEPLAVYEEEHSLSAKAREVEVGLLVHGVGELYAGEFLLKQVLHVGGVELGYVLGAYHAGLYGGVFKELWGACACHHHLVETELAAY